MPERAILAACRPARGRSMRHLRAWGAQRREVWVWSPAAGSFRAVYKWAPLGRKEGRAQAAREVRAGRGRQSAEVFRVRSVSPLRGAPAAAADARALLLGRGRPGGCHAFAFAAGLPRSIYLPLQWPSGVPRRCGVPGCQPCKAGVGGGDMVVAFAPQRVRPGWVSALCGSAPVDSFQAAGTCCCC